MMTIKRILCPTDLTRNSDQALDYALALARSYESRLIICYCTDDSEAAGANHQIPAESARNSQLAYAFSQVRTEELLKGGPLSFAPVAFANLDCRGLLIKGDDVGEAITKAAAEQSADLIVM